MTTLNKQICRLCYYETFRDNDICDLFNTDQDYRGKINKYLYLKVSEDDEQPKTICWMCSQHLETFHKFYSKVSKPKFVPF